jgi:hypothetical protein
VCGGGEEAKEEGKGDGSETVDGGDHGTLPPPGVKYAKSSKQRV